MDGSRRFEGSLGRLDIILMGKMPILTPVELMYPPESFPLHRGAKDAEETLKISLSPCTATMAISQHPNYPLVLVRYKESQRRPYASDFTMGLLQFLKEVGDAANGGNWVLGTVRAYQDFLVSELRGRGILYTIDGFQLKEGTNTFPSLEGMAKGGRDF